VSFLDVLEGSARYSAQHGNALALLQQMPTACVDAVITDAPYSSGGMFRSDRSAGTTGEKYLIDRGGEKFPDFAGDSRDQRSFGYWCSLWLSECLRITKPGGAIACFADWRQVPITSDSIQAGGWIWRGIVPWDKTEGVRPQMGRFMNQCEYVLWGTNGARDPMPEIGCLPGLVRCFPKPSEKYHQTGKPRQVMQELVRIAPMGGIVLDPFGGGGSTVAGALAEGRRCITFEIVPQYLAIIHERAQAEITNSTPRAVAAGQGALFGEPKLAPPWVGGKDRW
jgi:site-specific DNA-methyltransferase (adenine-specific)